MKPKSFKNTVSLFSLYINNLLRARTHVEVLLWTEVYIYSKRHAFIYNKYILLPKNQNIQHTFFVSQKFMSKIKALQGNKSG